MFSGRSKRTIVTREDGIYTGSFEHIFRYTKAGQEKIWIKDKTSIEAIPAFGLDILGARNSDQLSQNYYEPQILLKQDNNHYSVDKSFSEFGRKNLNNLTYGNIDSVMWVGDTILVAMRNQKYLQRKGGVWSQLDTGLVAHANSQAMAMISPEFVVLTSNIGLQLLNLVTGHLYEAVTIPDELMSNLVSLGSSLLGRSHSGGLFSIIIEGETLAVVKYPMDTNYETIGFNDNGKAYAIAKEKDYALLSPNSLDWELFSTAPWSKFNNNIAVPYPLGVYQGRPWIIYGGLTYHVARYIGPINRL